VDREHAIDGVTEKQLSDVKLQHRRRAAIIEKRER
jgi:hypothetical protein